MNNLPRLVLEHVFQYLNVQDSCSMRLVCSTFNQIFLQFSNPNFINSLHYVQLESDDKLRLFLSTFSEAEVPIPFPRFLWNVYIGSDAEVNDLGTLYASTMVELSFTVTRSIDLFVDMADYELFEPLSQKESLKRISTFLHLVGSTLELLEISFPFCWYTRLSEEEAPVPVLPKLSILGVTGDSILKWTEALIRKAPILEFVTRRNIINSPFSSPFLLPDLRSNLMELDYNTYYEDDQIYTEKWFLANARRYKRVISPFSVRIERKTGTFHRLWNAQIRNFEVLIEFDRQANHVFPRVQTLWTSPRTWLENPLKVFSPTKLPRLRRVILSENPNNLSTLDFPTELSYIYPNVVELFMRVRRKRGERYALLPYYKLFPNVTMLKLERQVTRNLIGLLNHFPKVRHLVIQYGTGLLDSRRYREKHDFDLECGAKPDVVSFKHLERLEFRYLNGSEEVMSRLIKSANASALPKLKSVYLWHVIPHETLRTSSTTVRQYGESLKEQELPNVTQLQKFFEIKWWISRMGACEAEQLV